MWIQKLDPERMFYELQSNFSLHALQIMIFLLSFSPYSLLVGPSSNGKCLHLDSYHELTADLAGKGWLCMNYQVSVLSPASPSQSRNLCVCDGFGLGEIRDGKKLAILHHPVALYTCSSVDIGHAPIPLHMWD